jgi:hypothetical protein
MSMIIRRFHITAIIIIIGASRSRAIVIRFYCHRREREWPGRFWGR